MEQDRDQAEKNLKRQQSNAKSELEQLTCATPKIEFCLKNLAHRLEIGATFHHAFQEMLTLYTHKAHSKPKRNDIAWVHMFEENLQKLKSDLEVKDKFLQISGSKLIAQKSKVEGFRNHISLINDTITNAEVSKVKVEKDIVKHQHIFNCNTADVHQVQEELANLDEGLAKAQGFIEELREQCEAVQQKADNEREILQGQKEELDYTAEELEVF
ncbi:hypothetical protein GYMLUDRAFT_57948 [Collybiopsis luxurians FD-317 M1]|uniref:Uncharacterized protein n=1 Tax=Collybiopsis luxurians FD-317 M1 TaxID=944289 RepID=A0A0D0C518_9AGAR|nr:hypothetical protein GYMLUDRAFT_57948 [Collybiopsis luxurians FD-317 M1]